MAKLENLRRQYKPKTLMYQYHLAGKEFHLPYPLQELELWASAVLLPTLVSEYKVHAPSSFDLVSRIDAWIGGTQRQVEVFSQSSGFLLRVESGSEFYISSDGKAIFQVDGSQKNIRDNEQSPSLLSALDYETILGPVFVLAFAICKVWSLHASAAMFKHKTIAFVGESGQGKSTLATYLDSSAWQRLADDILPVTLEETGILAWPHFPQLKLPPERQPGLNCPESLSLDRLCLLAPAGIDAEPELQRLPLNQAVRVLLSHTAGTRLFPPDLLAKHLNFCGRATEWLPVYQLTYPHRRDALPKVKELLECIC